MRRKESCGRSPGLASSRPPGTRRSRGDCGGNTGSGKSGTSRGCLDRRPAEARSGAPRIATRGRHERERGGRRESPSAQGGAGAGGDVAGGRRGLRPSPPEAGAGGGRLSACPRPHEGACASLRGGGPGGAGRERGVLPHRAERVDGSFTGHGPACIGREASSRAPVAFANTASRSGGALGGRALRASGGVDSPGGRIPPLRVLQPAGNGT